MKEKIREAMLEAFKKCPGADYDTFESALRFAYRQCVERGTIPLREDHLLIGFELELRTRRLFQQAGLVVEDCQPSHADAIVRAPNGTQPTGPLVLEVKGAKGHGSPQKDDLRQLDDWVFDLSGESGVRQRSLAGEGGVDGRAVALNGWVSTSRYNHPSPHKGVLVFNGLVGTRLEDRPAKRLEPNAEEFCGDHLICVIFLETLIEWSDAVVAKSRTVAEFWQAIHACNAILPAPST